MPTFQSYGSNSLIVVFPSFVTLIYVKLTKAITEVVS